MQAPEAVTWRPIRKGESIREYHEAVEFPVKFWNIVQYVIELPNDQRRASFLHELKRKNGKELAQAIRLAAWRELQSGS